MIANYMHRATIVIPLLRQKPAWLQQSVRSVLDQTVACSVIVVQSHLTPPDNRQVLSRLQVECGRLTVLTADADCGYACAFNLGVERACTERVGFLLADDWLEPDAVELCLQRNADIVSTQINTVAADGRTILETGSITESGLARQASFQEKADYLGHFLLFKRTKLLDVGGVDTAIGATGPDDYDLLWTMLERGASVAIVEKPLYNYRDHTESWRLSLKPAPEQLENLERILDKHDLPSDIRPAVRFRHGLWFGRSIAQVRERKS